MAKDIGPQIHIFQLNIQGLGRNKCEYLSRLAIDNGIDVIKLQEINLADEEQIKAQGKILGYTIVAKITSNVHGSIMYLHYDIKEYKIINCTQQFNIETMIIEISGIMLMIIYKTSQY